MQDYKFSEDYREKYIPHYCEWNTKKLKDCANNRRYDKKLNKKPSSPCRRFEIVETKT